MSRIKSISKRNTPPSIQKALEQLNAEQSALLRLVGLINLATTGTIDDSEEECGQVGEGLEEDDPA